MDACAAIQSYFWWHVTWDDFRNNATKQNDVLEQ